MAILWISGYLMFGFISYYFVLTTLKDKREVFAKAPHPVKVLYYHGFVFPYVLMLGALIFLGIHVSELLR